MTTNHSSMRTYACINRTQAITCGSMSGTRLFVRDAAVWETFAPEDLSTYLSAGVAKTAEELTRVADLNAPYTVQDEQQLFFMVESLVHARHALEDAAD